MRKINNIPRALSVFQLLRRIIFSLIIFVLLGFFQVVIWVVPFRIYARRLDKKFTKMVANSCSDQLIGGYSRLIGRLVSRMAKITPWPSKCLVQALTVKFLLRRFKIPNEMFIGVALDDKQKLSAHAWVNVANFTVVGGANSINEFKVMKIFKDHYGN